MRTSSTNSCTFLFVALFLGVLLNGCSSAASDASKSGERTYTVGGTVTGVIGSIVLQNNGTDDLTVSADGTFAFTTVLTDQATYNVAVVTPTEGKTCSVVNGRGTISAVNVTSISIGCFTAISLEADAGVRSIVLTWNSVAANGYNAYISSSANCDISAYQNCSDGALHTNVTSPYEFRNLQNGKTYYAVVEAIDNKGHHSTSPMAGARPNRLATNDSVWALAAGANGAIFLGGVFTELGAASGKGVPFDLVRGRISNPNYPLIDGEVQKVITDGSGGWFIAGEYGGSGGKISHILSDMTVDPLWQPITAGQAINALAYNKDRLFVASPVVHSGYSSAEIVNGLGAFKSDGSLLAWHPDPNGVVTSMIVHNNVLYVGGAFTIIAGQPRNNAAAFTMDGTLLPWDPNVSGRVNAIVADGASIFLGGFFGSVKGKAAQSLASVDLNGDPRNWGSDVNQSVWALTVHRGVVYAGGTFTQAGAQKCDYLIAINSDGTVRDWCPVVGGAVTSLASSPDSDSIFLGGSFSAMNGQSRHSVAAVGLEGELRDWDARLEEPTAYNSVGVNALAISGSSLYVGGKFNLVKAQRRVGLAAIDADGALSKFDAGLNGPIYALASDGDVIYAGGYFGKSRNQSRYSIASYDKNGALRDWKPMLDGGVVAIAIDRSTRVVYFSGAFQAVNGIQRTSMAAVGFDGTLQPWAPSITFKYPDYLTSMALFNNMVYIGGRFNFALPGGVSGSNLAAFDMKGGIANWSPNPNGDVTSLTANNDAVFLAGPFNQISGNTRNSMASFGADGILTAWNSNVYQSQKFNLIVANGPTIYASSKPTTNPAQTGVVTAINPNSSFQNLRIDTDLGVSAMMIRDASLFIGGDFTKIYSEPSTVSHFAEFDLTGRLIQ